jgi:hypothetical protein
VELPLHQKFGYSHMIEMRAIEDRLRANGITGVALHFAAVAEYEAAHKNDPIYSERKIAAKPEQNNLFRLALEEIRDGHNDPRTLARTVLETAA